VQLLTRVGSFSASRQSTVVDTHLSLTSWSLAPRCNARYSESAFARNAHTCRSLRPVTGIALPYLLRSRDSAVGIATGYGLDGRWVGVRVPVGSRIFTSRPALGPTQRPFEWVPGVTQPEREADHSPSTSAEVNDGAIPPLPHMTSWRLFSTESNIVGFMWHNRVFGGLRFVLVITLKRPSYLPVALFRLASIVHVSLVEKYCARKEKWLYDIVLQRKELQSSRSLRNTRPSVGYEWWLWIVYGESVEWYLTLFWNDPNSRFQFGKSVFHSQRKTGLKEMHIPYVWYSTLCQCVCCCRTAHCCARYFNLTSYHHGRINWSVSDNARESQMHQIVAILSKLRLIL
jgi:hypothetical protein